jgi:rod shape-determining protein MreC
VARVLDARKNRLLLGAFVVSHLVVISQQVDAGGGTSLLERTVLDVLSPLQRAAASGLRGVAALWHGYVGLRGSRQESEKLAERVASLEAELQETRQQVEESSRLREVLELKKVLPLDTVAAEVVARDGIPWFRTLTLNRGREAGIDLNAAVLSPTGVVGRVVAVGSRVARVQLIVDRDSGVGAILERSRAPGVVSGDASGKSGSLTMKYVSTLADVAAGDRVVTSGLDRIYPKGLVLGRVESVSPPVGLFKDVRVTPSARFDLLETVLVVRGAPEEGSLTESVR